MKYANPLPIMHEHCELKKSHMLMKTILHFSDLAGAALEKGARVKDILAIKSKDKVANAKFEKDYKTLLSTIQKEMEQELGKV